jgi:hypothetical protein
VIFVTIEMRQAPFYGWIHDLSAVDPTNIFNLFGLIPFNPATISPWFHSVCGHDHGLHDVPAAAEPAAARSGASGCSSSCRSSSPSCWRASCRSGDLLELEQPSVEGTMADRGGRTARPLART